MLVLALLLAIQSSSSDEPPPYPADPPCTADGTTYGMARCLEQQADVWEKRLNDEYGAALKRVSAEAAPSLRRAQRLWVKYREANCEMYSNHGGTVSQLLSNGCWLEMAKSRTVELHGMD